MRKNICIYYPLVPMTKYIFLFSAQPALYVFTPFQLEQQVSDLKKRLDELRKAKNTTIIKKDKEYVTTGTPKASSINASTGSPGLADYHKERATSSDTCAVPQNKLQEEDVRILQKNIASLKELHKAELEELRKEVEKQVWVFTFRIILNNICDSCRFS